MATRKKLNADAYQAGKDARTAGKPREPGHPYAKRPLVIDWLAGWDENGPVVTQEPVVENRDPVIETRADPALFWPKDRPRPTAYERPPVPCEKCGRVLTDERGRAVMVTQVFQGIARFLCKVCGHRFKLRCARPGIDPVAT